MASSSGTNYTLSVPELAEAICSLASEIGDSMREDLKKRQKIVSTSKEAPKERLSLSILDWLSVACIALVLLLASHWGGTFSTPPRLGLVPSEGGFGILNIVGISIILLIAGLAGLIAVGREWLRPVAIGLIPGVAGAFTAMGVWAALSVLNAPQKAYSLNALAVLFASLLIGCLTSRLARDRNALLILIISIIAAGTIAGASGVNEYLIYWKDGIWYHRTFGNFANPDFLAGFLLLTLPITLAYFASAKDKLTRLAMGVSLGIQSASSLLTGSRAGAGVLILSLLIFLLLAAVLGVSRGFGRRIGAALLVFLIGAGLGLAPTRSRVIGNTPAVVPGKAGAAPAMPSAVSAMEATAASQSHSGEFRKYTWMGTVRMGMQNPVLGTGIGNFETSYPRYALTAFTAHAHNGYLQFMGECGIPGLLLLLAGLAAITAFTAHAFLIQKRAGAGVEEDTHSKPEFILDVVSRPLLLCGAAASVAASLIHNTIDSDWYIAATVLVLGALLGVLCGLAREIAPLTTQLPRPLSRFMLVILALISVGMIWRGSASGIERLNSDSAAVAMQSGDGAKAVDFLRSAANADPFDPEPHLDLAMIQSAIDRRTDALDSLKKAVQIAPTGRTFYRLAQYYVRNGDSSSAIVWFERSRLAEPHNLQNLKALADVLVKDGKQDRADLIYREMTALENQPYGKVRAMPEMVETDFANAHVGLADSAAIGKRWAEADSEYQLANAILSEYWSRRNQEMEQSLSPEKRKVIADMYEGMLTRWLAVLPNLTASASEKVQRIKQEQSKVHDDRVADDRAIQQLQSGGAAGSNP